MLDRWDLHQSCPGMPFEVGVGAKHQHHAHAVGDRMMHFDNDCGLAAFDAGKQGQTPQRLVTVERLMNPRLGERKRVFQADTSIEL